MNQDRWSRRRWLGMAVATMAGALVAASGHGSLAQEGFEQAESLVATGYMQVIAQQVATFDQGEYAWYIFERETGPDSGQYTAVGPAFVLGGQGAARFANETTLDEARLASGEAVAVRQASDYALSALDEGDSTVYELGLRSLESGANINVMVYDGAGFDGIAGKRDVDLLRDVLTPGETATLAAGQGPTLVFVTKGTIAVTVAGEPFDVIVTAGSAIELAEGAEVRASGQAEAAFVAAVIGEEIPAGEAGSAGAESGGSGNPVPAPTPTPTVDTDGDGLYGHDELTYQTDPLVADTDGDGLVDGDEVFVYGTDPLVTDTDGDDIRDGKEVFEYGTDPTKPDTDGDGITDDVEIIEGYDPLDPADPQN